MTPSIHDTNQPNPQNSPGAVLVLPSRKSKADAAMEEGGAQRLARNDSTATFDETATASSSLYQEGSSLGGEEDAGEAFEKRAHVLFPGQHAEFNGLDPLSI